MLLVDTSTGSPAVKVRADFFQKLKKSEAWLKITLLFFGEEKIYFYVEVIISRSDAFISLSHYTQTETDRYGEYIIDIEHIDEIYVLVRLRKR